jgi:hypothetical protein
VISIIICSINEILLAQLKNNIADTVGVKYEIIAVDNTKNEHSIAAAYNLGASQANYPYLCFVHEDVCFHTQNWGSLLIKHLDNSVIALVGVFGSLIKTKIPSGVHIPIYNLNRVNQLQRNKDGTTDYFYENPLNEIYSEVAVLDGMFLANTINNHQKYPFDEHLLKGFHGYDIDYSLGQSKVGQIVVVYDILIEHFSHGEYAVPWIIEQLKIIHKWQNYLPRNFSIEKKDVLTVTIKNIESFLNVLFINNLKKGIQIKYLIQLVKLRPFSSKNSYFIRRTFIFGKTEQWLKGIFKD